jgi:hypothetical protein
LTGGHSLYWQYALDPRYPEYDIPADVPPWDHLRENRFPVHVRLNRWRLDDYRGVFNRLTYVIDETLTHEGEHLLDRAPAELRRQYSVEDLTTRTVTFTLRKKT